MAFPWKVMGEHARRPAPPQEGDQWRVGFSRVEWQIEIKDGKYVKLPKTPENNWIWSAQGVIDMHRPERWGFVQFTKKPPGTAAFVPDGSTPARDALQEVYYAQKSFSEKNKRWAATMEELGLKPQPKEPAGLPVLKTTADGYECSVALNLPGAKPQQWMIRHDSLIQQVKQP